MTSSNVRRMAGLLAAATVAVGALQLGFAIERANDADSKVEQVASLRSTWTWRTSTTTKRSTTTTEAPTTTQVAVTTVAPATTTPPAPVTTKAPAPTTTKAPVTTQAPAPTPPATVAPVVGGNVSAATQNQMLAMVNAKRASGTTCGGVAMPPVPPLTLNGTISRASDAYAVDMATHNYFGHTGRDGSDPGNRLTAAGYSWSAWAENIAAGMPTAADAVNGWFGSAGHCKNFMLSAVTQVGFGMAQNPASTYKTYWVSDLGRPA
jgi:uncharacterized protein YkwD